MVIIRSFFSLKLKEMLTKRNSLISRTIRNKVINRLTINKLMHCINILVQAIYMQFVTIQTAKYMHFIYFRLPTHNNNNFGIMLDGVSKLEPQSNYCPYTTLQFTICCVLAIIFAWSKHATFVLLPFFRCDYTVNGKRTVLFSSQLLHWVSKKPDRYI